MAHVSSTSIVDATGLERLRQCRRDIVDEELEATSDASAAYRATRAPFDTYRRVLDIRPRGDGRFDGHQNFCPQTRWPTISTTAQPVSMIVNRMKKSVAGPANSVV